MLVLVLILVVIALALVLAGLFLKIVVLAWASVGISLIAAAILVYDWLQTRGVVRAGRQAARPRDDDGDRGPSGGATAGVGTGALGAGVSSGFGDGVGQPDGYGGGYGGADMEPATQVLPVVPPASNASEETVVMPVVAPSGEAQAPPGVSRSSGNSSRSVTESEVFEDAATRSGADGTTVVDPVGAEPGSGGDPGSGAAAAGTAHEPAAAGAARAPDGGATAVTRAAAAGVTGAGATAPADDDATRTTDGRATDRAATASAHTTAGDTTAGATAGDTTGDTAGPDGATRVTRSATGVDEPTSVAAAVHQQPADADERTRVAGQQMDRQPSQDVPVQVVDTSGEAPEEPREATLAALVARLPDEVVVIDERPRYHVQDCPALPGQPVIPLPVSEAVELGFTPCGWCTPNRALGERHGAEVR